VTVTGWARRDSSLECDRGAAEQLLLGSDVHGIGEALRPPRRTVGASFVCAHFGEPPKRGNLSYLIVRVALALQRTELRGTSSNARH
jgi:hypothetical protein